MVPRGPEEVDVGLGQARTWEEECYPRLRVIDPSRPVALCVLWNLIEKLEAYVPGVGDGPTLALIGNLRTPVGISWFIRGLWKFPLGRVIVWGSDLTGSGEALIRLWKDGPTTDHRVPGFGWKLDRLIPPEAIDTVRKEVELVDLRGSKPAAILPALGLPVSPAHRHAVTFPPVPVPRRRILPSSSGRIAVDANNPGQAWQRLLHHLLQYARPRETRKEEAIIHAFDVRATFPVPPEDDPAGWFNITPADAERYVTEILRPTPPTTVDASGRIVTTVDYHYGQRLYAWRGHNQVAELIERLRSNHDTKRASAALLEPQDLATLEDAPCWSLSTFANLDGALCSSHVFRSHDMFGGWPNNVLAILRIHRNIASALGLGLGRMHILSQNAQIYTRHLAAAADWVEQHGFTIHHAPRHTAFRQDPAGTFVISIVRREPTPLIRAQLVSPDGDEVLWEAEQQNPHILIRWIVESMILDPQHVRYLGTQEERLRNALATGQPYQQG